MNTKKLCILIFTALAMIFMPLNAAYAALPEPTDDFFTADYAQVISSETEQKIISTGRTLAEKTGAEIVVVTLDFIDGEDIEQYAYDLFNYWQLGSAEQNNGVLILLVIGEENYWGTIGAGLEDTYLSVGTLSDFFYDYLEDDFAAGNYDAGVLKLYDALSQYLAECYNVSLTNAQDQPQDPVVQQPSGTSENPLVTKPSGSSQDSQTGTSLAWLSRSILYLVIGAVIFIIIIIIVTSGSRRRRRTTSYYPPVYPRYYTPNYRPHYPRRVTHRRVRDAGSAPPQRTTRPSIGKAPSIDSPRRTASSSGKIFSGGFTRGGGASRFGGRSSSTRSSSRSTSFRSSASSRRSSGGGFSRGGGAGRRKR